MVMIMIMNIKSGEIIGRDDPHSSDSSDSPDCTSGSYSPIRSQLVINYKH